MVPEEYLFISIRVCESCCSINTRRFPAHSTALTGRPSRTGCRPSELQNPISVEISAFFFNYNYHLLAVGA